ncbi:MAG: ABC transporter permease [Acidobacteria bacterium]|nr:ABC transporter permease [Acidobacteriota bacterium]
MYALIESFKLALASLRANKLRSALTLIGVIFGVMTVVAVASVIEGANRYIAEKIADQGANTLSIEKFGIITSFEEFLEANRRNKDLTLDDVEYLRERMTLATYIGASGNTNAEVKRGNEKMPNSITVKGVTASMANIDTVQADIGRYIGDMDEKNSRYVTMIGTEVADRLFGRRDVVGLELKIDGLPFEVIGVAKEQGTVFGQSQDEFVMIPVTTFQKNWGARRSLSISIKGSDGINFADLQDQARMVMRIRHKVPYSEKDTFGIITADAINDLFQTLTGTIATVALLVTSISLVVGGIVIMNIMLVAVTERTREIGIRKSLGARRKDILMQFLIESVVLSGCGGLIGLGIAYGIKWLLVQYTPVPASMPIWAIALALIVSTSTGAIFGIYPAWKAARLDPIVALRAE